MIQRIILKRLKTDKDKELVSIGSSLNICLVADGEADIYPRFGPTMEWDTAAAHAVVIGVGMDIKVYVKVYVKDKSSTLEYNKQNSLNPFFIVSAFNA
jgi:3'(2'), 5'-bisphosphate nucleotidase